MKTIIVMGYMGSGKSTIGKMIAKSLNFKFIDLDDVIVKDEHLSVSNYFKLKGEIAFRKKESLVLQECLRDKSSKVISLGGGTPCYGNNLKMITSESEAISVYLKLSVNEIVERLWVEKDSRPLISHLNSKELLEDFVRKHLFERNYYYNQSDVVLNCDAKTALQITEEVIALLF